MGIRRIAASKATRHPIPPTPSPARSRRSPEARNRLVPDSHRIQEGIKEIIRAEQLEAMGKLDAIFGKRAQNIAGEFTAEATQGPQQLKTNYQQRSADHIDVHAKAERDEVPVAFQDYVQRYFELVKDAASPVKGSQREVTASTRRSRTAR
jgi:hypothetical protein